MNGKLIRDRLLASTIIAGAVAVSAPAFAQNGQPASTTPATDSSINNTAPSANGSGGGEIIVTGSRLPQPNLTSASPVTVLNSQDIKQSGVTRVEDLLNQLPQVFGDQGSGVSNGASGTATVNLRNLGANRTLVLVNGRRLGPGDPGDSAADLNFIPATLIKRVDVETGGASATYGADAVGGVVNFIMDTDYTGFKVDAQYDFYQHDNNSNFGGMRDALNAAGYPYPNGNSLNGVGKDVTTTVGASFDDNRGHVVAYLGYRRIAAVTQDSRDYSSCGFTGNSAAAVKAGAPLIKACSGSATSDNYIMFDGTTSTYFQLGNGRTFVPGNNTYNFQPTNYYQRPDQRYTAGFFAHYDVSDAFKPYMEGMFMDDHSVAQIAPSGDFGNTTTINCDNPLLSAQQLGIACAAGNLVDANGGISGKTGLPAATFYDPVTGTPYQEGFMQVLKRNTEGGPRRDDLRHTDYRGVIGAKGDIAQGISYDAYYQIGRTLYSEHYDNDVSVTRLKNALDVVNVNGVTECRSVETGTDPNCVPYDIFTAGGVSQAALNYIEAPGFEQATVTEQVASGSITALLGQYGVKTPWADEGVSVNVGAEWRRESLKFDSDLEFQTGDLAGQGAATLPVSGAYSSKEVFAEIRVPVIHNGPIYDLSFDGGYRFSSYNINGTTNTNTFKGEANFAPIKDINFRFSYNRAVRAPNIQELYAPQHVALDGSNDPCAGSFDTDASGATLNTVNGFTAAQCANTGVTAAEFGHIAPNPAQQYNGLIGGNPNLKPEKADTFTVGVVLQPRWVPNLSITVDAFSIKVKDVIQGIGEDTILTTCAQTANPTFCGLVNRDQFGSLWRTSAGYVVDTYLNLGSIKTRGIDVGANYSHEIGMLGTLGLSFNGTYLDEFKTDNGVSTPYDCAGYYGDTCGTPAPKWRHRARLTYTAPNGLGLSLQWRYFGSVKVDSSSSNPTLAGVVVPVDARIKPQSYFDMTFTAKITDQYTFRLGVNNLLDRDPPLISQADLPATLGNGSTFPTVYDALGRYVFAGVTLNF